MKAFTDESGATWIATAHEEDTPRHHGRWYLVLHPEREPERVMALPEIRWQTRATAERTIRTMSEFELRRRLRLALDRYGARRHDVPDRTPFGEWRQARPGAKGGSARGA